jgi:hypothetical protein
MADAMKQAGGDVLRIWSYEDRNRKISCLYNNTMNSGNIKYTCIFGEEKNNRLNITMVARRLQSSISYSSNICVDIGDSITYCDVRQRIFVCLAVFFYDCISEITSYELYCKMIALYRVDWDLSFVTHIIKRIRACKNYKLSKIINIDHPVMF